MGFAVIKKSTHWMNGNRLKVYNENKILIKQIQMLEVKYSLIINSDQALDIINLNKEAKQSNSFSTVGTITVFQYFQSNEPFCWLYMFH